MENNLRAIALENAVRYGRNTDPKTILQTSDTFLEWLERKPSEPIVAKRWEPKSFTQEQLDALVSVSKHPLNMLPYVMTHHPTKGLAPFASHPYVKDTLNFMHDNRFGIVLKSRQIGGTIMEAIYALWLAMFKDGQTILILGNNHSAATEILNRIKTIFENLPDWMRANVVEYNKQTIRFDNRSRIITRAASDHCARGFATSLILVDEAAYVPFKIFDGTMNAIMPCVVGNGKMMLVSTAGKAKGLFYDWCMNPSQAGFAKLTLPYTVHPDRDEEWAKPYREQLGEEKFKNEFECIFL